MAEIWRDIEGYDGLYQVSNLGHVKRFYKATPPRILKASPNSDGYPFVKLYYDGKRKHALIHRLVALAFIPNPDNKPEVNHVDGIKTDNHVDNLEWVTDTENKRHAFATGLQRQGEDRPDAKLTAAQVVYIRDNPDGLTGAELATMFSVDPATISGIQRGKVYRNAGGVIRKSKRPRVPDEIKQRIRAEYVFGSREFGSTALAKKYGIAQPTILKIVHGR